MKFFSNLNKKIKNLSKPNISSLRKLKPSSLPTTSAALKSKTRGFWKRLTWRKVLRGFIILVGAGIVMAIILFAWFFKDLPRPGELRNYSSGESTILYDRNGNQIYDISGDERRIVLKNDEIPTISKQASIAIEDKNFYKHHGIDFRGLARAILSLGKQGGGSTIDQQYIKNAVLSPKRSPIRKMKEIILALELEATYSKDDIISLYLNEIPFGSNIYGLEAASQTFFGHSAKDGLTLSEAATLAAIPNLPTRYSPYGNHVDLLIARKNRVLDNMAKTGAITQAQADEAKTQKPLIAKDFAQKRENFPAPHFVMYVREQLVAKYGEDLVQRGGLRVTTTLDLDTQKIADDTVKNGAGTLAKVKATNAALTAVDPKTGQVLAMVGAVDYFDQNNDGNFNVATAQRQPGSSIKPLVYSTLFKGKYSPSSMLWDVDTNFNGYQPDNFDGKFHGPLTVRTALGNSFNIPAVKALSLVGIKDFLSTAKDMGITTLDDNEDSGLPLALGAGEVKLVDLTAAYGVLANSGKRAPLTSILKVQDSKGKTLDEWKDDSKQVLAPEIAYEISDILSDSNAKKPTFTNLLGVLTVKGKQVAVKTGTTNNYKDAWTMGYTPSIAVGVWAGNNNGAEMDHGGGSTAAAPIWDAFMEKYLASKPNEAFAKPDDVTTASVDFLSGKKPTAASGQVLQDIFAPWQLPTKDDDVHYTVKICKSNGLLATDSTPASEIINGVYSHVRSERPDNPDWERPVQAWARGAGLVVDPPTQKCDISITNPEITITSPENNATVSDVFSVTTDTVLPTGTSNSVDFFVDNVLQSTDDSAPYSATIDTSNLSAGNHTLLATIRSSNGNSASNSISFHRDSDTTPPGEVTNVTVTPGGVPKTALASWTNPSNSDLKSVAIYVSQASGVRGSLKTTLSANPGAFQSTTLTGLVSGVANYVTFVPIDNAGNQTQSTHQYSVTPF
jgi:penicillin-binding protein 1C